MSPRRVILPGDPARVGRLVASGLRTRMLELPAGFDLYQRLVGAPRAKRRFVEEVVRPRPGERILDVGCGTGALLPYLPAECPYVGVDVEPRYIARARGRWGARADFVCADVADLRRPAGEEFDVALAFGVLHHLRGEELAGLAGRLRRLLADDGRFAAAEPVATAAAGAVERFLMRHDRGAFIREAEAYRRPLEAVFARVTARVVTGTYRIPFTVAWLEARASG